MKTKITFKAIFKDDAGIELTSVNAFTIEEMASYEEHEWEFDDESSLPSNDVEPGDLRYLIGIPGKNGEVEYIPLEKLTNFNIGN